MQTELYRHFDADGRLLYVGVSWSAVVRYGAGHRHIAEWAKDVAKMTVERFDTRGQAEAAERKAIREECPLHNRQHQVTVAAPIARETATAKPEPEPEPYLFPDASASSGWANAHRSIIYAPHGVQDAQLALWGAHPAHVFRADTPSLPRSARRGDWVIQIGARLRDETLRALRLDGVTCVVV